MIVRKGPEGLVNNVEIMQEIMFDMLAPIRFSKTGITSSDIIRARPVPTVTVGNSLNFMVCLLEYMMLQRK